MSVVPSAQVLQKCFLDNLDFIEQNSTVLQPSNKKQLTILRQHASQPLTIEQLAALVQVPVVNGNAGLNPLKPLVNQSPEMTTCSQFGSYNYDWYFMFGNCQQVVFTMSLFIFPVCNPTVAARNGVTLSDAHLYSLNGGIAINGGPWVSLPQIFLQGVYQCTSDTTFNWTAVPPATSAVVSASLSSTSLGTFQFALEWKDPITTQTRTLNVGLTSPTAPAFNAKNGCVPCVGGVGTLYWSYPNMQLTITTTGVTGTSSAKGWLDRQWVQGGKFQQYKRSESTTLSVLSNLTKMFRPGTMSRWLWLIIQDETKGQQYMVLVSLTDDLAQLGKTYTPAFINQYDNQTGVKHLNPNSATVTVKQMVTMNNYTFPTQHHIHITLPNNNSVDYILTAATSNMIMYNPTGCLSWEGPGSLTDLSGQNLGYSFLEANFALPTKQWVQIVTQQAGLSQCEICAFQPSTTPFGASVASLGIVVLFAAVVVAFVLILWRMTKKVI